MIELLILSSRGEDNDTPDKVVGAFTDWSTLSNHSRIAELGISTIDLNNEHSLYRVTCKCRNTDVRLQNFPPSFPCSFCSTVWISRFDDDGVTVTKVEINKTT